MMNGRVLATIDFRESGKVKADVEGSGGKSPGSCLLKFTYESKLSRWYRYRHRVKTLF